MSTATTATVATDIQQKLSKISLRAPVIRSTKQRTTPSVKNTQQSVTQKQHRLPTNRSQNDRHRKPTKKSPAVKKSEPSKSSTRQPTIFTIMMTRQLARNYVKRFRQSRQQMMVERPVPPTYQLEPTKVFSAAEVKPLIKHVIDKRMKTFRYQPETAALLTKILATECRDAVKVLSLTRYKIMCQIYIGEKKGQTLAIASRCAWDCKTDDVVTYNWQSANVYCTATVHAIYRE